MDAGVGGSEKQNLKASELEKPEAVSQGSQQDADVAKVESIRDPVAIRRHFAGECNAALKKHLAYNLIPGSGKVVVFDSQLPVSAAFCGLKENEMRCAPVWDSVNKRYLGMLSVTDFIDILRHHYVCSDKKFRPSDQTLQSWQSIKRQRGTSVDRLLCISPECSVFEAVRLLLEYRVHRLCVVQLDLGNTVLAVLSSFSIMRHLLSNVHHLKPLKLTLKEAAIGQYTQVPTLTYDTPLIEALALLVDGNYSALPIVNSAGCALDYYSRNDSRFLVMDETFHCLDMPLKEALAEHAADRAVPTCMETETLWHVCRRFITTTSHTLLIIDPDQTVKGLITLEHVFKFISEADPAVPQNPLSPQNPVSPSSAGSSQPQFSSKLQQVNPSQSPQGSTSSTPPSSSTTSTATPTITTTNSNTTAQSLSTEKEALAQNTATDSTSIRIEFNNLALSRPSSTSSSNIAAASSTADDAHT
eukprot:CAMPEP_0175176814 /NCGR_PEP_ID=MMETSP0087-20121206/34015_1 /TAXON_ID=136419 /ORGANISM="Unknown Unknown, Strain D1" /LENGTH=471 /DNA_ID=CAMNT_0016468673 /DNA_START=58 /DNA_END=1473 /DNA_ORIENTATION=-